MKVYTELARAVGSRLRCIEKGNDEWKVKWTDTIDALLSEFPHGSGFDNGTKLDDSSTGERLIFNTAFHHMNDNGMYNGWTEHQVIVTPSLEMGFRLKVSGRDRNEIKDYIAECFDACLSAEVKSDNAQSISVYADSFTK